MKFMKHGRRVGAGMNHEHAFEHTWGLSSNVCNTGPYIVAQIIVLIRILVQIFPFLAGI